VRPPQIARMRMVSQHLWGAPPGSPVDAVRWLGALQAQEFSVARWSVGQRCGADQAAVDRAFSAGAILRIHVLRPTWHFVASEDIRWILRVSAGRVHAVNAHYYRKLELDDRLLAKTDALLRAELAGGAHLTRAELGTALRGAGIDATGSRLAYVLMHAELEGVICSGPPRGKRHTYALLDERAPPATAVTRDEALARLTKRYFTSRGPATLKDYLRWGSLTASEARQGLGMVASQLENVVVDGRTYWLSRESRAGRSARRRAVDLVQVYDECVMSYSESRDVLLSDAAAEMVLPPARIEVPFIHAVLLDGQLIGHWRHAAGTGPVVLEIALYKTLHPAEREALYAAADRYARFLGAPVSVRVAVASRSAPRRAG
jgi:hypothetical protein